MYLMLFVDRSVRFLVCCGPITRNDILCCGSFTRIVWCVVARSRGMIYSVVIVRSFFNTHI